MAIPIVSTCETLLNANNVLDYGLDAIAEGIRSSQKLIGLTAEYRALSNADKGEFKRRNFPLMIPAGTFTQRRNDALVQHGGCVVLDFDPSDNPTTLHDQQMASLYRAAAADIPSTILAFVSPSNGVKVLVRVNPIPNAETHRNAFEYAAAKYAKALDLQIDPAGDVARACFLCHDPGVYFNADARPLDWFAPKREDAPVQGWRNQDVDWGAIANDVVAKLRPGVKVNERLSRRGETRYGNHGSLCISDWGGVADFENDVYGGVLDLVMYDRQASKRAALEWLTQSGFMPDKQVGRPQGGATAILSEVEADSRNLPIHQRFAAAEATDLARLELYARDRIKAWEDGLMYARKAYWTPFTLRGLGDTEGFIRTEGLKARIQAVKDLPEGMAEYGKSMMASLPDTANHWQQVTRLVRGRDNWDDFGKPYDYAQRPVLPMADGVWDVHGGHKINADASREFNIMAPANVMREPNFTLLLTDAGKAITEAWMERYGGTLTQRLAFSLLGPTKRIESIRADATDFGKSTIGRVMRKAFGSGIADTEEFEQIGKQFSLLDRKLVAVKMLFVDDVNEVKGLQTKAITRLTADTLTIERKGIDAVSLPRSGTVWFVGNDWAEVDMSASALKARLKWARNYSGVKAITREQAKLLNSRDAPAVMQAFILDYARNLPKGDLWQLERQLNENTGNDIRALLNARGG